jgi:hypothetical protein
MTVSETRALELLHGRDAAFINADMEAYLALWEPDGTIEFGAHRFVGAEAMRQAIVAAWNVSRAIHMETRAYAIHGGSILNEFTRAQQQALGRRDPSVGAEEQQRERGRDQDRHLADHELPRDDERAEQRAAAEDREHVEDVAAYHVADRDVVAPVEDGGEAHDELRRARAVGHHRETDHERRHAPMSASPDAPGTSSSPPAKSRARPTPNRTHSAVNVPPSDRLPSGAVSAGASAGSP